MKKTILFTMVLVFIGASQCFGGSALKYVTKGLDVVGLADTGLREAGFEDINIRKLSKPLGTIASAKDVVMVGITTAAVSGSSGSAIISSLAAIGKSVAAVTSGAISATVAGTTLSLQLRSLPQQRLAVWRIGSLATDDMVCSGREIYSE